MSELVLRSLLKFQLSGDGIITIYIHITCLAEEKIMMWFQLKL